MNVWNCFSFLLVLIMLLIIAGNVCIANNIAFMILISAVMTLINAIAFLLTLNIVVLL